MDRCLPSNSEHEKLPADQTAQIVDTLRLAEHLRGETAMVTGQNIPKNCCGTREIGTLRKLS
jgi:hypothetical protein